MFEYTLHYSFCNLTDDKEAIIVMQNAHKPCTGHITVMFLSFRTDRSGQTVQTQIRLLLEEQSDQGLHCLPFRLHPFGHSTLW